MAAKKYRINTPIFRGRFMNVFTPKTVEKDDGTTQEQFQCTALFPKGEMLKEIKNLCTELMTDKFGLDVSKWPKPFSEAHPKGWRKPWFDQASKDAANPDNHGEKTYEGFESGALAMNMKSNYPIDIVLQNPEVKAMPKDIYDGAYYIAHIDVYWYGDNPKAKGNKGIAVGVLCIQKVREGEPLTAAGVKAASVFKAVAVDTSQGAGAVFEEDDPMA